MFEPLGITEMQIKATRYYYMPTRMTKVKTTDKAKCKEGWNSCIDGGNGKWYSHLVESYYIIL